jgi:hypothetical protein
MVNYFMDKQKDLIATLANVRVIRGGIPAIELDFVLRNHSKKPIYIAERWNSWGAFQWQFHVVDAVGKVYLLQNPQQFWTKNFLTTVTILPGGRHMTRCHLGMLSTDNPRKNDGVAWFREWGTYREVLPSGDTRDTEHSWVYPLQITGEFAAPTAFDASENNNPPLLEKMNQLTWVGEVLTERWMIFENGVVKKLPAVKPQ